jgi:hypothetical protein
MKKKYEVWIKPPAGMGKSWKYAGPVSHDEAHDIMRERKRALSKLLPHKVSVREAK